MPYSRYIFGQLPWYGVLVVSGMAAAILLAMREEKRLGLPRDTIVDLALWLLPTGILGARIYYILFAWETFAPDPLSVFRIWEGGLAIYGGIIAGAATLFVFARIRHLSIPVLFDSVAPGVALAQCIGRWGNFFNSEAYGLPMTDPAFQWFPAAVLINGEWHMATFFYESLWNLIVFSVLWLTRKRKKHNGDTVLGYLLLYGCGRLVIEGLRMDSLMTVSGTGRVSQLLSALLACTVLALWTWRRCRRQSGRTMAVLLSASAISAVLFALIIPVDSFMLYRAVASLCFGCCVLNVALTCVQRRCFPLLIAPLAAVILQVLLLRGSFSITTLQNLSNLQLSLIMLISAGILMAFEIFNSKEKEAASCRQLH